MKLFVCTQNLKKLVTAIVMRDSIAIIIA